ncbi:MAG: hypothetical protein R6T93_12460, partial [Trueperaceae bacterium]
MRVQQTGIGAGGIQVQGGFTDQTNLASLSQEGLNKFTITIPVDGFSDVETVQQVVQQFDTDFPGWSAEAVSSG